MILRSRRISTSEVSVIYEDSTGYTAWAKWRIGGIMPIWSKKQVWRRSNRACILRVGMKEVDFIARYYFDWAPCFCIDFIAGLALGASEAGAGPHALPLGLLLCGLSLGTSFTSKNHEKDPDSAAKEQGHAETSPKKIIIVIVSLIAYALALEKLGYLVATSILLFILFWTAGSKKLGTVSCFHNHGPAELFRVCLYKQ